MLFRSGQWGISRHTVKISALFLLVNTPRHFRFIACHIETEWFLIKLQDLLSIASSIAIWFKMEELLKSLTLHSVLQIVIIQLLLFSTEGWEHLHGCKYNKGVVYCDFLIWSPPLMDYEFGPEPVKSLSVFNISGNIPTGVKFSIYVLIDAYLCLYFSFMFEKECSWNTFYF